MNRNLCWILSIFTITINCSNPKPKTWDEQNIRSLEVNSPEVKYAMKLAQENISNFLRHYSENAKDSTWSYFMKYGFMNSETTEHMWLNIFQIEPTVKGILDNVPQRVTHVSYLDSIEIELKAVEDFMIYHGDTLKYGDYLSEATEKLASE